jgi:hypothetical protein
LIEIEVGEDWEEKEKEKEKEERYLGIHRARNGSRDSRGETLSCGYSSARAAQWSFAWQELVGGVVKLRAAGINRW